MKVLAALGTVIALCACADNGQTGSPAGTGGGTAGSPPERMCAEHDCIAELTEFYGREFGVPPTTISVVGSECVEMSFGELIDRWRDESTNAESFNVIGPLCACQPDHDGGPYLIGWEPLGCAVRGHAHDCLMEHGESGPCEPSDPDACESVCAELHDRFHMDARTSKPFRVRSARCSERSVYDYLTTECSEAVIEVEGYCYDAASWPLDWNNWQSCELDYEGIVNAPRQVLPDCDDVPSDVPATADCRPACDDASDCRHAYGCDYGPSGEGFGRSGRGRCEACSNPNSDCLPTETCAHGLCVLRENAECDVADDCERGTVCTPSEVPPDGRGNEGLTTRCLSEEQ